MAAVTAPGYSRVLRTPTWIEATTTASVMLLAGIAAVVSYGHMHQLALRHGEGAVASALIPLSVDGMIVAASMSLLLDSRLGRRGGLLPRALLITGALASLAANIAVAEPAAIGRVIAAWPSFALTASYELLMRQVRHTAIHTRENQAAKLPALPDDSAASAVAPPQAVADPEASERQPPAVRADGHRVLQRKAWQWALANRRSDGALPSGTEVAQQFRRCERWGRLVKKSGLAGQLDTAA